MPDYRIADSVLDGALNIIKSNTENQVLLSADPVNFAGVAAVTLATVAMASGDFTLSAGTVSGRKVTVAGKTSVTPSANGTATHLALLDNSATEILLMVPIPDTSISTSTDIDFASWVHEMRSNEAG